MTAKQILKRAQEIFFEKLQEKTNWGRTQIKEMWIESMNEALMESLD